MRARLARVLYAIATSPPRVIPSEARICSSAGRLQIPALLGMTAVVSTDSACWIALTMSVFETRLPGQYVWVVRGSSLCNLSVAGSNPIDAVQRRQRADRVRPNVTPKHLVVVVADDLDAPRHVIPRR